MSSILFAMALTPVMTSDSDSDSDSCVDVNCLVPSGPKNATSEICIAIE